MKLKLWQIDAFADRAFAGNPAAVVPLDSWLPDAAMQAIANENNLSETAFFVPRDGDSYDLRWFTPKQEVPLCGHATLAAGWVVLNELTPSADVARFHTKSGELSVTRGRNRLLRMTLPADTAAPFAAPAGFAEELGNALGVAAPDELYIGRYPLAVWNDPAAIRTMVLGNIDDLLRKTGRWGLVVTAGGAAAEPYDFISRFFAPLAGVPEDPVCGSAHCLLTPFWARRLGKRELTAYQASPRGGTLLCTDDGERVVLSGPCALYMRGEIEV
jgi:PhzF family phenazine biosynthesis protein